MNGHLDRIAEWRRPDHLHDGAGHQAQFHQATLDAGLGVEMHDAASLARRKTVERSTRGFTALPRRVHAGDLIRPISLTSESRKQVAPHMSHPPGSCSAHERGLAR